MTKPKYRLLRKGETIREGDEYRLAIPWSASNRTGEIVRGSKIDGYIYRRRIGKGKK